MKRKISLYSLAICFVSTFFISCLGDDNSYYQTLEKINFTLFQSFSLQKNDSVAGLEDASFVLKYEPQEVLVEGALRMIDSVIVNLDSLPKGTRIDSVGVKIVFYYPYAAYAIYTDDNTQHQLQGTDTLDFSRPMVLKIISGNQKVTNYYRVKVNVHNVIPYLYQVERKTKQIIPDGYPVTASRAYYFANRYFFLAHYNSPVDANAIYLYSSTDLIDWQQETPQWASGMTTMGALTMRGDIVEHNNKLYVIGRNKDAIYTSANGTAWTAALLPPFGNNPVFCDLIMSFNGKLWAVVKTDSVYNFESSDDGTVWTVEGEVPAEFPVRGFRAVANSGHTGKPKSFLYGGTTRTNKFSTKAWVTEDGKNWFDFQPLKKYPSVGTIVAYNNKLLQFGGYVDSTFVQMSIDEGFSWDKADTAAIKLPDTFALRVFPFQNVFVDAQKRIVVAGGVDSTGNQLSDVWTLKLNSIDW